MPSESAVKKYSGNIYLQRVDQNGVAVGEMLGCFHADLLTYQPDSDEESIISNKREDFGQPFHTEITPNPAQIGVNFLVADDVIEAASIFGTISTETFVAGTATADTSIAKLDGWVSLGRRNIDPLSFILTDDPNTAVYTATTTGTDGDYEFNARLGRYRAIPTGAIANNQATLVTWTSAAYNNNVITAGTENSFRVKMEFDGKEQVSKKDFTIDAPLLSLAPAGEAGYLGGEFAQYQFNGTAIAVGQVPAFAVREKE